MGSQTTPVNLSRRTVTTEFKTYAALSQVPSDTSPYWRIGRKLFWGTPAYLEHVREWLTSPDNVRLVLTHRDPFLVGSTSAEHAVANLLDYCIMPRVCLVISRRTKHSRDTFVQYLVDEKVTQGGKTTYVVERVPLKEFCAATMRDLLPLVVEAVDRVLSPQKAHQQTHTVAVTFSDSSGAETTVDVSMTWSSATPIDWTTAKCTPVPTPADPDPHPDPDSDSDPERAVLLRFREECAEERMLDAFRQADGVRHDALMRRPAMRDMYARAKNASDNVAVVVRYERDSSWRECKHTQFICYVESLEPST